MGLINLPLRLLSLFSLINLIRIHPNEGVYSVRRNHYFNEFLLDSNNI